MASLLFHRLMECAKEIEGGNLDVADSLLAEIQSLAPKEESMWTRKCLKLSEVSVREVNEASGSEGRLDDERMPNIPQETREPLEQVLFYTEFLSFFLQE